MPRVPSYYYNGHQRQADMCLSEQRTNAAERKNMIQKEIDVKLLDPHPYNPRRNIGNLQELTDSIKKKGIMQNLTVVPAENGRYTVLIGHRRLAASKLAGLTAVPCRIAEGLSMNDQISIMLLENMQREDITPVEQAQGFQMMLDLGDTVDTICKKTGFSASTVKHRLNIAKLDQKEIKRREKAGFQLSITDYIALEKVRDVEKRNEILATAANPTDILGMSIRAAADEKRQANEERIRRALAQAGVKEAPASVRGEHYSGKWEVVREFSLDERHESADYDGVRNILADGGEYWYVRFDHTQAVCLIRMSRKGKELTEQESARNARKAVRKKAADILREAALHRREAIQAIIAGKTGCPEDTEEISRKLRRQLLADGVIFSYGLVTAYLNGIDFVKVTEEDRVRTDSLSDTDLYLILAAENLEGRTTCSADLAFIRSEAARIALVDSVLAQYGFPPDNGEYAKLLDGTSRLYASGGSSKARGSN